MFEKFWHFKAGPFEDQDGLIFAECLVEDAEGNIYQESTYFPDVDSVYVLDRYFKGNIMPITVDEFLDLYEQYLKDDS